MALRYPADRLDAAIDCILAHRLAGPTGFAEFIPGHHFAPAHGEGDEHLHDPALKHDALAAGHQLQGRRRHLHIGQRELRLAAQVCKEKPFCRGGRRFI
ncbi:MAG TPA: hypothetical protein VHY34_04645 [Caulobacteraceae bacterium]|nr:hypothetical protein [Caulobacteraceae bacterium]